MSLRPVGGSYFDPTKAQGMLNKLVDKPEILSTLRPSTWKLADASAKGALGDFKSLSNPFGDFVPETPKEFEDFPFMKEEDVEQKIIDTARRNYESNECFATANILIEVLAAYKTESNEVLDFIDHMEGLTKGQYHTFRAAALFVKRQYKACLDEVEKCLSFSVDYPGMWETYILAHQYNESIQQELKYISEQCEREPENKFFRLKKLILEYFTSEVISEIEFERLGREEPKYHLITQFYIGISFTVKNRPDVAIETFQGLLIDAEKEEKGNFKCESSIVSSTLSALIELYKKLSESTIRPEFFKYTEKFIARHGYNHTGASKAASFCKQFDNYEKAYEYSKECVSYSPWRIECGTIAAETLFRLGRFDESLKQTKTCLTFHQNNPYQKEILYDLLGDIYYVQRNYKAAAWAFKNVKSYHNPPYLPKAAVGISLYYASESHQASLVAVGTLEATLKLYPKDLEVREVYCRLLLRFNDPRTLVELDKNLSAVLELTDESEKYEKAVIAMKLNLEYYNKVDNTKRANSIVEKILQINPTDLEALQKKLLNLIVIESFEEALNVADFLSVHHPENAEVHTSKFFIYMRLKDYPNARVAIDTYGRTHEPEKRGYYLALKATLDAMQGKTTQDYERVIVDLRESLSLGSEIQESSYALLGSLYNKVRNYEQVVEANTSALNINKKVGHFVSRAEGYIKLGKLEQAWADIESAAKLSGNDPIIDSIKADYFLAKKPDVKDISAILMLLNKNPNQIMLLLHYLKLAVEAKNIEGALTRLREFITKNPKDPYLQEAKNKLKEMEPLKKKFEDESLEELTRQVEFINRSEKKPQGSKSKGVIDKCKKMKGAAKKPAAVTPVLKKKGTPEKTILSTVKEKEETTKSSPLNVDAATLFSLEALLKDMEKSKLQPSEKSIKTSILDRASRIYNSKTPLGDDLESFLADIISHQIIDIDLKITELNIILGK